MLRNPIHLRLSKMTNWQSGTFMACLCERMYPNYQLFCRQSGFGDEKVYQRILDLLWEVLLVKESTINFDRQLEKLEQAIPETDQFAIYAVYPAIDACAALSEAIHAQLNGDGVEHSIEVSRISLRTVAMLTMSQAGQEMSEQQLNDLPAIQDELDLQWHIFRLLMQSTTCDLSLIKGLRAELREAGISNIGINLEQ